MVSILNFYHFHDIYKIMRFFCERFIYLFKKNTLIYINQLDDAILVPH